MDDPKQPKKRRNRLLFVAVLGAGLGVGCTFLPHEWQALCLFGAKLIGVFGGT